MVDDRVTDGRRIAQLLASELRGHERGPVGRLAVVDVRDVEGSEGGEFAYAVAWNGDRPDDPGGDGSSDPKGSGDGDRGDGGDDHQKNDQRCDRDDAGGTVPERVAAVYVHGDRARVEFGVGREPAAGAASAAGLRVRPVATRPPKTLVFVESGAEVKRALDVFRAVAAAVAPDEPEV